MIDKMLHKSEQGKRDGLFYKFVTITRLYFVDLKVYCYTTGGEMNAGKGFSSIAEVGNRVDVGNNGDDSTHTGDVDNRMKVGVHSD